MAPPPATYPIGSGISMHNRSAMFRPRPILPPPNTPGGRLPRTHALQDRAFLETQPFGTVPAAFSPDGRTGIFNQTASCAQWPGSAPDVSRSTAAMSTKAPAWTAFSTQVCIRARQPNLPSRPARRCRFARHFITARDGPLRTYLTGIEQALAPRRSSWSATISRSRTSASLPNYVCFTTSGPADPSSMRRGFRFCSMTNSPRLTSDPPFISGGSSHIRPSRRTSLVTLKRSKGARLGSNRPRSITGECTEKSNVYRDF